MAREFVTHVVRGRDDEGRLIEAGFEWSEVRPWLFQFGVPLFSLGMLAAAGLLFEHDTTGTAGLGVAIAMLAAGMYAGRRDASVTFVRHGKIATPHGFPGYRNRRFVAGTHKQIRSIERVNYGGMWWYVEMSSASGNIVTFAQTLDKNEAYKITVQLNAALADMRSDLLVSASPVSEATSVID